MREQRVLLALDEPPILPRQPAVLGLAHLVQRLTEMPQHMELVEQDGGVRCVLRFARRGP